MLCLIPARYGSERVKDKNIVPFFGHPLLAYTIRRAIDSQLYSEVVVTSDSEQYLNIAKQYGAEALLLPGSIYYKLSSCRSITCSQRLLRYEIPLWTIGRLLA